MDPNQRIPNVNREQLLETVCHATQPPSVVNGGPAHVSLSRAVREIQQSLMADSLPRPDTPLPSAECVAAFIAGSATPEENEQVIRASAHDLGILLQVTAAVQTRPIVPDTSPELTKRLLSIGPKRAETLPRFLPPTVLEPQTQPVTNTRRFDASTKSDGLSRPWVVGLVSAASLLVALTWFLINNLHQNERTRGPSAELRDAPALPGGQSNPGENLQPRSDDSRTPDNPLLADDLPAEDSSRTQIESAIERLEDELARQGPTPQPPITTPQPTEQALAGQNSNHQESGHGTATGDPRLAPMPGSQTDVSLQPAIAWTQVTGILAQQTESGYDRWQAHSTASLPSQTAVDAAVPFTPPKWLTLPGCYARGKLAAGGRIVVNQDSCLSAASKFMDAPGLPANASVEAAAGRTILELRFGSLAMLDVPAGHSIEITGVWNNPKELRVEEPASFYLKRLPGGIQLWLQSGKLTQRNQPVPLKQALLLQQNNLAPVSNTAGPKPTLPKWARQFPTSSILPRGILANLDDSVELGDAIDAQLVAMARNLNRNNAVSRNHFTNLCRWRVKLSVEDGTGIAKHPLWFVRTAAFDLALNSNDYIPSIQAKRLLLAKLRATPATAIHVPSGTATNRTPNPAQQAITVQMVRNWIEFAGGRRQASRQDIGQWLQLLTVDDRVVAAFADYLLRKRYANGPTFDPRASAEVRTEAQRAWRQAITGG